MSELFEYLFMPLKIKDVTSWNRVMITGHGTLMGASMKWSNTNFNN